MAKTIAELSGLCSVLDHRLDASEDELTRLRSGCLSLADQLAAVRVEAARSMQANELFRSQLDECRQTVREQERLLADQRRENELLRQRLEDHLKQSEEWDRRRWGMAGLFVATFLSFVANLIVAWVKK